MKLHVIFLESVLDSAKNGFPVGTPDLVEDSDEGGIWDKKSVNDFEEEKLNEDDSNLKENVDESASFGRFKKSVAPISVVISVHGYTTDDNESDGDNITLISKLDVSNPLHLHPNDSAALTIVTIKLKGTKNYHVWSNAMLLALEERNKTGFIDGSCRRSNVDEVLCRQWDRVNAVVLGWILNSITEELSLGQIFSKRATHVWEELKETYDKLDGSVTFNLHHKIHTMKQNGSTLADYYHNLNALWKQFYCLVELPRCTCHAADDFKKHNQLMKLMQFLMGLDDSYMSIRSSILSRDPLPDVRNAYATISSEESHRVIASSMSDSSQRTQTAAFASNAPNRTVFQRGQSSNSSFRPNNSTNPGPRPNNNNQSRQNGGSGLVCENCGFNGHTIDRCFKLIGYPADFGKKRNGQNSKGKSVSNNSVSGSSSSSGFTDEQLSTLISLIKDNSVSGKSVQANMAGFESKKCSGDWLGHPANPVLRVLKPELKIDNTKQTKYCETCQRAKQIREPFPLSDHTSSSLGELVHLDLWGPYKVTSSDGLPSSVLNGKSPFELIYNTKPNLSNLRVFGCLCFATVLNNHDKLGSRSEKCVMMGYSSVKKGYRLYSLDKHQFIFSRDVKFFETVFPFKDSVPKESKSEIDVCQDVNHLNFFDLDYPEIPSDDNEIDPSLNNDSSNHSDSSHSHVSGENDDIIDIPDSGVDADNNGHIHATHDEQVTTLEENTSSEGNEDVNPMTSSQGNQNLRRSSRVSVFPRNYNDFVVESKVKYGLEKF
ncbi:ribonuclease H-like domain-containing protein, partial [Tanacetum coccineum]